MRTFNGYMEYRYVCNNCGSEFDENDKLSEGDVCPECKDGKINDYSQRISPEEHKERYMDMKADEYCDNGGE